MNPDGNFVLWVVVVYQCLLNCNKCTTVVPDVDKGESYAYGGVGHMQEVSVPSSHLGCENKTALKNKIYLKKKKTLKIEP